MNNMDSKVIELINRHGGFLDANEISVLTKINYRRVKKDIQTLNECITKKR
jgi:Fic family protein